MVPKTMIRLLDPPSELPLCPEDVLVDLHVLLVVVVSPVDVCRLDECMLVVRDLLAVL